jgi:hypothetical protein
VRDELGIEIGYSTLMAWLHDKDYRLKVPQPWPDRQNEDQRQEFVEQLREWIADEQIELWFTDESGNEGDPRPRRRFAREGTNPRVTKNGDHIRMNVAGMVCPRTGQFLPWNCRTRTRNVSRRFCTKPTPPSGTSGRAGC